MTIISSTIPHKIIGVAVIWDNNQEKILIDRRRLEGEMGGLWEFPGGKIEGSETIPECIKREIKEELGIEIEVDGHLITVDHNYKNLHVTLTVHHCHHLSGIPQPLECAEICWVTVDELKKYSFPEGNIQIIDALVKYKAL
jgi:8-oxo-dGTP diphosphatase